MPNLDALIMEKSRPAKQKSEMLLVVMDNMKWVDLLLYAVTFDTFPPILAFYTVSICYSWPAIVSRLKTFVTRKAQLMQRGTHNSGACLKAQ